MPRLLISPDPAVPGFFYAEDLDSGRRLSGLSEPKVRLSDWYRKFPSQVSLSLSDRAPSMVLVEHPAPSKSDRDVNDDPTCLEPGCLQPAPLYCEAHRHQMEGSSY